MNTKTKIILFALSALAAEMAAQGSRIMLTQLERGQTVDGTRAGQIGLTNANGDQRYAHYVEVPLDTIDFIPAPSGNVSNFSEFVYDTLGGLWYIDWQGNAVEFGMPETCDTDFLQISDNSCPDALTDSLYKYRYLSVGARYVFPGAELLVNDSLSSGIAVVQGFRNARLALYDSNAGNFLMIDHGSNAPVVYMPVNANLVFKTTAGTPQTPIGSQVNHFAINTQDSTIQMYRYPNTRADTQSVVNFLYTDPVGKVRSRPITYIIDSIGLGENIYNSNGTIPPGTNRIVNIDTLANVKFTYPGGIDGLYLYAGDDSTGINSLSTLGVRLGEEERYVGLFTDYPGLYISQGQDTLALPGQLLVAGEDGTFQFARPDTISGLNSNIYNTNGTIGPDLTRTVRLDTTTSLVFENTLANEVFTIYSGDDSTTVNGFISMSSPDSENTIEVNGNGISAITPYTEFRAGDVNNANTGTGVKIDLDNETFRAGDVFADDLHGFVFNGSDNYTAMYYNSLGGSYVQLGSNQVYDEGQDVGIGWTDGFGLWIASQNQTEVIKQNSEELEMYGGTYSSYRITGDTSGNLRLQGRNDSEDRRASLVLYGNGDGDGYPVANLSAYDANAPQYTLAEIVLDTAGVGINTRGGTGNDGDVLHSNGSRTYWAPASGGENIYNSDGTIEESAERTVSMGQGAELNFLYANGGRALSLYAGDDGSATNGEVEVVSPDGATYVTLQDGSISMVFEEAAGEFQVQSDVGNNALIFSQEAFAVQGADTQGSEATYVIQGDTTSTVLLSARRNVTDQDASLTLTTTPGGIVTALLQAYNADAPRTTNAVQVDTSGVGILTQGSDGDAGQVLQSDGDKSYWGVTIEDGIIGADMLSYNNLVGWETVNANRALMATTGGGSTPTLTPSVGVTEIIVTDTATTSTVNLNYVPGELDGASFAQPFTTVRYIYNWGSGDCTVDTNQDWLFRTQGNGAGQTTLTIPTGQSYKLVWVQGSTEANSRFWCFRLQ